MLLNGKSDAKYGYVTPSGWNALLPARIPAAALNRDLRAEYAIVGAGYAGLAVARRLSELDPQASIVVLDANEVGEGASARNSGFISLSRMPDLGDKGRRLLQFTKDGLTEVRRLVDELEIECDFRKVGGYRCSATERGEKELRDNQQFLADQKLAHMLLTREQLNERIGTNYYAHGLFINDTYLLQPAALVRGLADKLPQQVQLFENTPVTALQRHGQWILQTPGGHVSADTVVLAGHSFVRKLGYLRDRIVGVLTYAGLTQQLDPSLLKTLGSDEEWGVSPTFKYGTTMRKLPYGRLMFRSLYSYEVETPKTAAEGLHASMRKHFPQLSATKLEHVWGGVLAMTRHGAPFFGRLDDKLYSTVGCNGSGIAKFTLLGKYLAEEICGTNRVASVRSTFGTPGWIPPEPFRRAGFGIVSAIGKRFAGKDV